MKTYTAFEVAQQEAVAKVILPRLRSEIEEVWKMVDDIVSSDKESSHSVGLTVALLTLHAAVNKSMKDMKDFGKI